MLRYVQYEKERSVIWRAGRFRKGASCQFHLIKVTGSMTPTAKEPAYVCYEGFSFGVDCAHLR